MAARRRSLPQSRDTPIGALELDLARLQDITDDTDERGPEDRLGRRQRQVHRAAENGPLVATRDPTSR